MYFPSNSSFLVLNGDHPQIMDVINWNKLVLKKEDLTDDNWLYIGDATEEQKTNQLKWMKEIEGWVPIFQ